MLSAPSVSPENVTSPRGPGASAPTAAEKLTIALRLVTAAWLLMLLTQVALLAIDAGRLRRLVARARRPERTLEEEHDDLARDLGLRAVPALRESSEVRAPQVVGVLRPTVLLPLDAAASMSPSERTMVLCHELAHVRRGDLVLGWIPALAARALAWHPLARLAAREYALAREAACDALVLRTLDAPPRDYGRLLVRLGVHAPAARIAAAGTSPTAHLLRRRLHMLQHASLSPRALTGVAITAGVIALVPLRLVAVPASDWIDAPQAVVASAATPVIHAQPAAAAVSEVAATSPQRERRDDRRRDESWVYLYGDDDSATMNGDTDDLRLARRLRGGRPGPFFLFRHNGEVYTIDDRATLERIDQIFAPQRELGEQQGALGNRQGALGEEQGKLGEKQGKLGEQQGELGMQQAEVSARLAEAHARRQLAEVERMRNPNRDVAQRLESEAREKAREAETLVRKISEQQEALGRQQDALGREQEKLGEKQAALGAEQEKLGEQQERAGKQAERELRELVAGAIASGIAKKAR